MSLSVAHASNKQIAPWLPANIPDLVLWLDASDSSTLPAAYPVSQWADRSGNTRHATQANSTYQPVRVRSALNNRWAVRCGNSFLSIASTGFTQTTFTYFLALRTQETNGSTQRIVLGANDYGNFEISGAAKPLMYSGSNVASPNNADNNWHVVQTHFNGGSSELWFDGVRVATGSVGNQTNIPSSLTMGMHPSLLSQSFNGDYGELLIINGSVTYAERIAIEGYLAERWGLLANLPATHPYRLGGATWQPADLGSRLTIWLDADDDSRFTLGSAISTLTEWRDKSSHQRHTSQQVPANRPTVISNARNGRSVVRFDGTASVLKASTTGLVNTATVAVAMRRINVANGMLINNTGDTFAVELNTASGSLMFNGNPGSTSYAYVSPMAPIDTWHIAVYEVDYNGTRYFYNGTQGTASTMVQNAAITGTLLVGGWSAGTGRWLAADIGELLFINRKLSENERQKLEGYLANRWGLGDNLPSDHPYKTAAPTPAPSPWTPKSHSGIALWLDGSDSSTMTMNASNRVTQWRDKSGFNRHANQSDSTRAPTYTANVRNGLGVLRFRNDTWGGDWVIGNMGLYQNSWVAAMVVIPISFSEAAFITNYGSSNQIYPNYLTVGFTGYSPTNANALFDNAFNLSILSPSRFARINGTVGTLSGGGTTWSADCTIGRKGNEAYHYRGDICEIVMMYGTVSLSDIDRLEGYLAHKWGAASMLPAIHPYKNGPP